MNKAEAKQRALEIADFLKSEFGTRFISTLSLQYNALHQVAESESLTAEQKAMKIERAAGIKWVIDYLTERQRLLESGHFNDEEET